MPKSGYFAQELKTFNYVESHKVTRSGGTRSQNPNKRQKNHKRKQKSAKMEKSEDSCAENVEEEFLQDFVQLVLEPEFSFKLPRISAALERLMGTNVVRLTDRKFMGDLRSRISEDYREQLERRIRARELKEVERERLLIIEGKSDVIPKELADDPIFVVNQAASVEIQKQRAKLKTNRERNAEHLKLQGMKWERERLLHEEEERQRIAIQKQRRTEQKQLEERYREEDLERGMDLLRIDNEDWRECEQKLKEFLENERAKMKERSLRVPTPFTSDPLDILNIVRARQKFRETEQRIRQELEEKMKEQRDRAANKEFQAKSIAAKVSKVLAVEDFPVAADDEDFTEHTVVFDARATLTPSQELLLEAEEERKRRKYLDDVSEDISEDQEVSEHGSTISESKRRHAEILNQELDDDYQRGLIVSKEHYNHLRYEEVKILELRQARNIREMYRLAEEIIIGERIEEIFSDEEEEQEPEEAGMEEDEDEQTAAPERTTADD